jgi:hypothetical protein
MMFMIHSPALFCPSKVSARNFRVRDSRLNTKQSIVGVGFILTVILLAGAAMIDKIMSITWGIFLVSMVIFYYIRKLTSKLILSHYDLYTIMAEIEEQDKAIPAHVFATPTRASSHFLQLFYHNREKLKLTTRYNIDPVSLQKIGEDEGFIIEQIDAERLAMSLMKRYPNLVMDIRIRAERRQNMGLLRKQNNFS